MVIRLYAILACKLDLVDFGNRVDIVDIVGLVFIYLFYYFININ